MQAWKSCEKDVDCPVSLCLRKVCMVSTCPRHFGSAVPIASCSRSHSYAIIAIPYIYDSKSIQNPFVCRPLLLPLGKTTNECFNRPTNTTKNSRSPRSIWRR